MRNRFIPRVALLLLALLVAACDDDPVDREPVADTVADTETDDDTALDVAPDSDGGDTGELDGADTGDLVDTDVAEFEPPVLPPTSCAPASLEEPRAFVTCDVGSGETGRWIVDAYGLPAYDYRMVHELDPRAVWTTTGEVDRRDHLFQLGNDRLIVTADNDGFVQLFERDRGPVLLNRVSRQAERTGGGYSYVAEGDRVWASAYGLRPEGATTRRVFGIGYVESTTTWDELEVRHRTFAPFGQVHHVIDEVTLTNLSATRTRELRHYEYWDPNRHALELQLYRSGTLNSGAPASQDRERNRINQHFTLEAIEETAAGAVRLRHTYDAEVVPDDQPSPRDTAPDDIFLARLAPAGAPRMHTERAAFIGDGDATQPQAAREGAAPPALLAPVDALGSPGLLADELELVLAPGESTTLRYAFGSVDRDAPLAPLAPDAFPLEATLDAWRAVLPYVAVEADEGWLHRETTWHGAQLLQNLTYDGYLQSHTVAQGGAYLYLHGLDGAARDFALFATALTWLRPEMAREQLRTIARMTYADGHQISYALQGYGVLETALIHHSPSDLDLFFLWALVEYVAATGDTAFLDDEPNPYWPRDAAAAESLRAHARNALRHLLDEVGLGAHGLIRLRTGDWSDGIAFQAPDHDIAVEEGESIPNSQMALWVLPRAAALVESLDAQTAADARALAIDLRARLADEWAGQWYRRAWFDAETPYGDGHLDLEAQIWALIGDLPDATQRATLLAEIATRLEDTSGVGARRAPGDMVWHAVTGLLTWGYAAAAPERAWPALQAHTMTRYAERNPEQWYGIWSGPDGIGPNGGTWASEVTPMRDWPVYNMNQHALPLLALVRVAGLEPLESGDGLRLAPALPAGRTRLELPLLSLDLDTTRIAGTYHAATTGSTRLVVALPEGATGASATLRGAAITVEPGAREVELVLGPFAAGDEVAFEVTWQ